MGRTEADHYDSERRRKTAEIDTVPEREKEEVREVFADVGLSPTLQTAIADELAKNRAKWPGHAGPVSRFSIEVIDAQR